MTTTKVNNFVKSLSEIDRGKIIRSALADDVPFEAIKFEYNLTENEVIQLMKKSLPIKQFIKWRDRARGSNLKHLKKQSRDMIKKKKISGKL